MRTPPNMQMQQPGRRPPLVRFIRLRPPPRQLICRSLGGHQIGSQMAEHDLSIRVNLDGLVGQLQNSLQATINLTALGLRSIERLGEVDLALPGTSMQIALGGATSWDTGRREGEFRRWILVNAFRDAAEATGTLLEEVRRVLAIWRLVYEVSRDGKIRAKDWDEGVVKASKRFHRLGLPDKLNALGTDYGLSLDPGRVGHVLSINAARNTLVHRKGIVSERDANTENGLLMRWEKLGAFLTKDGEEREVVPPMLVEAGTEIVVQARPMEKLFALNSQIEVNVQEFADVCWTLFVFGESTKQLLEKHGRARGVVFSSSPGAA